MRRRFSTFLACIAAALSAAAILTLSDFRRSMAGCELMTLVAVLLAIWPLWHVVAGLRHDAEELRRIDLGLCRACGYDLRHSSGRCPECGRAIKPHEKVRLVPPAPADPGAHH